MNREELEELYNEFVITNGEDYWKYLIMEYLIQDDRKRNVTEEQLQSMADTIINNDELWSEIDRAIANAIIDEKI